MDLTARQFTPERVQNSTEKRDYLPVETINNLHELMHKPLAWEVLDGKWLPILSPLYFFAGLNNYDDLGAKDKNSVRTVYRQKGCSCIDPEDPRLGEYMHYMGRIPATNPRFNSIGWYWVTMFENPEMVAGQVSWALDRKGYDAFRTHLVASGICVINATIAGLVVSEKRKQLAMYAQIPMGTEARQERVAALKKEIAAMEKAMKGLAGASQARVAYKVQRGAAADDAPPVDPLAGME